MTKQARLLRVPLQMPRRWVGMLTSIPSTHESTAKCSTRIESSIKVSCEATDLIAGSEDEQRDLKTAFISCKGSLHAMLEHIPHATHEDEDRLIGVIRAMIKDGLLEDNKTWTASSKDKTAKGRRAKAAARQAKEAEASAKELGVWDEFYGSGKKGARRGEEESGLQALILKRQRNRAEALDAMETKYANMGRKSASKRKSVSDRVMLPNNRNPKYLTLNSKRFRLKCLLEGKRPKKRAVRRMTTIVQV
jgi:hypothetical protein